jgi:hypothetical protein
MEKKLGFTKIGLSEFEGWLTHVTISRTIKAIQQHHTWSPNYSSFNGNNHFQVQKNMKDFHVEERHFSDIAQHFTIFPDGVILTGRDINTTPAGIKGFNTGCICIENVGNFDAGNDQMTEEQKQAIVLVNAELCKKLNLKLDTNSIVYHHWFNLDTGVRNNGTGNNKTCPGTTFFGGNTVKSCSDNFLPLIWEKSGIQISDKEVFQDEAPTFQSEEDYQDVDEVYPSLHSN